MKKLFLLTSFLVGTYAHAGLVVIDANDNVQEYSSNKATMQPRSGPPAAPAILVNTSRQSVAPSVMRNAQTPVKKAPTNMQQPSGYVIDANSGAPQTSNPEESGVVVNTMQVKTPPLQQRPVSVEQVVREEKETPMNPSNWRLNSNRLANDFGFGVLTYEQLMQMPTLEGGPQEWRYIPKTNVIFNVNWFSKTQ